MAPPPMAIKWIFWFRIDMKGLCSFLTIWAKIGRFLFEIAERKHLFLATFKN
jgi:hypothetical protein